MLSGELARGARLPSEASLAKMFDVSRPTVREALRLLAAQHLVQTAKGAHGGSYVTAPSARELADSLSSGIVLLAAAEDVTLAELLEARELIEVPAARLAARRHDGADLTRLHATIPENPLDLPRQTQFVLNRDFHASVIECCGNPLLAIAAQPIFRVLQTHLSRSVLNRRWHRTINDHHCVIAAAIEARDEEHAAELMLDHLKFLRPYYERAWRALSGDPVSPSDAFAPK
jgi:GntR family transcriptional regulator, transcriptional repressor for pyruvate dehydrogenase complex